MHLKAKLIQKWKSESALRWCFWFYYPHLGKTSQEPLQRSKQNNFKGNALSSVIFSSWVLP